MKSFSGTIIRNNAIRQNENDKINDKKEPCSDYILHTLEQANQALTYKDFGTVFSYGTLRNGMSKHVTNGKVLNLPRENPARFILPEWTSRPEYSSIQRNDNKGMAVRFDFLSFLEDEVMWEPTLGVHSLKLAFQVYSLDWLRLGWKYCTRSHSYSRAFQLSHPVKVQCFDTGTVLVNIRSSARPFKLDPEGLMSINSLLGEVKNVLGSQRIPDPSSWTVVQWHLNRDSEPISVDGLSFHVTFRDYFHSIARLYYKQELKKTRAETVQAPHRSIKDIFEMVLNRSQIEPEIASLKGSA